MQNFLRIDRNVWRYHNTCLWFQKEEACPPDSGKIVSEYLLFANAPAHGIVRHSGRFLRLLFLDALIDE